MININETVDFLLEEEVLEEGWFESFFTGKDRDQLDKLKAIKSGITTNHQKETALKEIDEMIDNSNRIITNHSFTDWLADIGLSIVTAGLSSFVRVIMRATNGGDRKRFKEALYKLRGEIATIKVKEED